MSQRRAILSSYVGVVIIACIIFIAGGRLNYWQAWLYLGLAVVGTALTHLLAPRASDLAARRAANAKNGERWDRRLMGLYFLLTIVTFVVAGLDSGRFGWSDAMPLAATVAGSAVMVLGQLIFAWARRANAFFSSTVQIEAERSHAVCTTGPYRLVRHPGYLGMALSVVGFPFVLGSRWACVPVALCLALLLLRVQLEDRFLQDKLAGYREYAGAVRYKLIPAIY